MMAFIYFLGVCLIIAPIIAILVFFSKKHEEKIEKQRQAEIRVKEMAKREEEYKKEVQEREAERKAFEEKRAQERAAEEERLKALEEKKTVESEIFDKELSEIPRAEIVLSEKKLNNLLVLEMDEIKTTKPRKNAKRSSYGRFTVIDIETTGLKIQSEIIELSAIKYYDFQPMSAFSTLIKPSKAIPEQATYVNGITDDMVKNSPSIKQVLPAFIEFLGKDALLGHNIEFDLKFLYKYGFNCFEPKRKFYDTLEMARQKLTKIDIYDFDSDEGDVKDFKLDTLCEHYEIFRSTSHQSLSDCYATGKLFIALLREYDLLYDFEI